jgi:hypothetical protein
VCVSSLVRPYNITGYIGMSGMDDSSEPTMLERKQNDFERNLKLRARLAARRPTD